MLQLYKQILLANKLFTVQKLAAEIVSVLAMTLPDDKMRDCLTYRLLGVQDELGSWGHEYVRCARRF